MVDRDRVVYIDRLTHNAAPMGVVDGRLYQSGNSGETETTTDKRLDCNLVGRIQYRGGPVLRDQRLARQNKRRKAHRIRRLEGERCHLLEVEARGSRHSLRPGQAIGDRDLHIGWPE